MRAWTVALLLAAFPAFADDNDTVTVPRETFVGMMQQNLYMRAKVNDLADKLEQSVKDYSSCVESRST